MPIGDEQDRIWIQDVMKAYGHSRVWWDKQIEEGRLSVVTVPGDRRLYLSRTEVERFLEPRIERGRGTQAG